MPRLETTNRSEVFAAVQKKRGKVSDALGFSPTLISVRPMGLAITSLSPTKAYLFEAKKSKRIESYKLNFLALDGEMAVQVGIRKPGKQFQFIAIKASALTAENAAKEVYYKLTSNLFNNDDMPDLKHAYDAQLAKLTPPPMRPQGKGGSPLTLHLSTPLPPLRPALRG